MTLVAPGPTDNVVDLTLRRLEQLEARLEAAGLLPPAPPTVSPFALPPYVAPGDIIASSWGNSVVDNLDGLRIRDPAVYSWQGAGGTSGGPIAIIDQLIGPFPVGCVLVAFYHGLINFTGGTVYEMQVLVNGTILSRWQASTNTMAGGANNPGVAQLLGTVPLAANTSARIQVSGIGTANVQFTPDYSTNFGIVQAIFSQLPP